MYTLEHLNTEFHATPYAELKKGFNFAYSAHGYWILPNGDVLSLTEPLSHGKVAAQQDNSIFDHCMLTASQTNGFTHFKATLETHATYEKHWVRVNMNAFNNDITCSFSKVSKDQLASLKILLDTHDPDKEVEYWWDRGSGTYKELMKAINED